MLRYALPLLGLLMLAPILSLAAETEATPGSAAKSADEPTATKGAAPGKREAVGKSDANGRDKAAAKAGAAGAAGTAAVAAAPSPPQVVTPTDAKAAAEVAAAYLNALKGQGFVAAPTYLHPDAMARFKTLVMPGLKDEQVRGNRNLLNATFGRDASFATAAAADPADFLSRFARLIAAREPDAAPRFGSLTPIGVVREGEQLHVLVRLSQSGSGPEAVERIEVVSLLPQGKDWKVALDSRLQDLGRKLGTRARGDDRRLGPSRFEPLPEGVTTPPAGPQGPAGLPSLSVPGSAPEPAARPGERAGSAPR
jgi:hypothetical protein